MSLDPQGSPITEEPPSTRDAELAIAELKALAAANNDPHQQESLQRVVTFMEHIAPLLDPLKALAARGNLPDMSSISAMLHGGGPPE